MTERRTSDRGRGLLRRVAEFIAPQSTERILLVILSWAGLTIGVSRLFDSSWVRWEILVGTAVLTGWTVWAIHYRLEQHQLERYETR